ncbi:polyamine-transporting ATPase [Salipiger pallidus]|uniref:Polyamine-transporting ATPase n=1 Tax=Salipiger pallidus TaxID=1775170 RepID=A0A8J2ZIQ6_9RHOB|nr:ABC transporter ATP-binding protein [Salipiger pallidus]GGG68616.1 polyamine-transporting ATPase [Salipiger pallidus]
MYLQIKDVSKTFGTFTALSGVDLSIEKNEFVSLLGPSGSGKSTLLRLIAGLEQPTTGQVLIDGQDVTALPPYQRGIAMVFQDFLLFPHMTVRENLLFPLRMLRMNRDDAEERIDWCCRILSLTALKDRFPNQLSGGQQQRVALGRGLVCRPKVLLLDEPLANLDRELRRDMEIEIRSYQIQLGIPFVYVTHNQEEALSMSDKIAVVNKGGIEDFAEKSAVYDRPKTRFIAQFVGRSNVFTGPVEAATEGKAIQWHGQRIALGQALNDSNASSASAYIKIEDTLIEAANANPSGKIAGTLRDVIFRGQYAEYLVTVDGGQEVVASSIDSATRVKPGDPVLLSWDTAKLDVFPDEVAA